MVSGKIDAEIETQGLANASDPRRRPVQRERVAPAVDDLRAQLLIESVDVAQVNAESRRDRTVLEVVVDDGGSEPARAFIDGDDDERALSRLEVDLLERIASDEVLGLSRNDLAALADSRRFVGRAPEQVTAFLDGHVTPILSRRTDRTVPLAEAEGRRQLIHLAGRRVAVPSQ
jgi:hypothetical protein